ncbi:flagellar biosynthetic protein FliR [Desulfurispirillum indicum]|uniref:Flagellar biosynthetic protein FliR n=1 Tax=Desulfurispirillum indicum (strain ATCC BAA-1389 / DSM 22839 / S5) TaxID=653733 RepID=E6W667_DESIS|nr:flagellar biosynthetic protein FliR [Desulfurispirillum indicum]ADU66103.1 type III secretion system inner membrane R protein [Desulfurispirillum indicum S5]UCZ55509.1 flagellar biosynthetic protein FliR [Desulfurispirillum indicum]
MPFDPALLNLQEINTFILSFIRTLSIVVSMPVLGGEQVKMQVKIGLSLLVSALLFPMVSAHGAVIPPNIFELMIVIFKEIFIGLAIGFAGQIILGIIQFAGQIMGFQVGLSMSNVLDPMTNIQVPIIGQFLTIFVVLLFLLANGHHYVFMGLYESYTLIPLGMLSFGNLGGFAQLVIELAATIFYVGFKITGPVFVVVLISQSINGILGKMVPQINLLTVGLPVQIFFGLLTLALVIPALRVVLEGIFSQFYRNIFIILRIFAA